MALLLLSTLFIATSISFLFYYVIHMSRLKNDVMTISCKLSPRNLSFLKKSKMIAQNFDHNSKCQHQENENQTTTTTTIPSSMTYEVPMIWGWNPHVQNLYTSIIRSNPKVQYRREVVPDPVYLEPICLDWVINNDIQLSPETPTLIILPGITGSLTASYVNHFVSYCKNKFRVVVYSRPGCDPNTALVHHQFRLNAHTKTIAAIIDHVDNVCQQKSPLVVASFSMGGQNISRYLVDYGDDANKNLVGCLAICNPFNTTKTVHGLADNYPLIDRVMTGNIKRIIWNNLKIFTDFEESWLESEKVKSNKNNGVSTTFSLESLKRVNSLRDLDQTLTKYLHNFDNVEKEYYIPTSVNDEMFEKIKRPLVYLHARDDPVVQDQFVPKKSNNENIVFLSTKHGSHCSYALMHSPALPFLTKAESFMEVVGLNVLLAFVQQACEEKQ